MAKRRLRSNGQTARSLAAKGKTDIVCLSCRDSKIKCTGCAEFACAACAKKKIPCVPAPKKNPTTRRRVACQSWTGNAEPNDGLDEPVELQRISAEQSAGGSQVEAVGGDYESDSYISSIVGTAAEFDFVHQDIMQFGNYTIMDHKVVGHFYLVILYFESPSQPFVARWKFDDNLQRWSYLDGPTELKKFVAHMDRNGIIPYSSVQQTRMLDGQETKTAKQEDIMSNPTAEGLSSSNKNQWDSLTNGNASLGESQSLGILEQWFESGSALVPQPYVTDQSY